MCQVWTSGVKRWGHLFILATSFLESFELSRFSGESKVSFRLKDTYQRCWGRRSVLLGAWSISGIRRSRSPCVERSVYAVSNLRRGASAWPRSAGRRCRCSGPQWAGVYPCAAPRTPARTKEWRGLEVRRRHLVRRLATGEMATRSLQSAAPTDFWGF